MHLVSLADSPWNRDLACRLRTLLKPRKKPSSCRDFSSWAHLDLNQGPHPYQGCALTNLSYEPEGGMLHDTPNPEPGPIAPAPRVALGVRRHSHGCCGLDLQQNFLSERPSQSLWCDEVDARTDIELVYAALEHPDAFGELVRRHQAFVFGAALRVTRDASLAEEVAQETFFRAYRALSKFRREAKLRTWLYRIATNLAIDLVGRRKDFPVAEVPETPVTRTTSQIVELRVQSDELRGALASLPETLRDPIVLREYHGMMYAEIADKLAVPLNTVRTRIFRSKATLRAALSDWEEQS